MTMRGIWAGLKAGPYIPRCSGRPCQGPRRGSRAGVALGRPARLARCVVAVSVSVASASAAAAQAPAGTLNAPASSASSAQENTAPTPPPDYTYAVEGRRDPFVRTVGRTTPTLNLGVRPQGIAGLLADEVVVRGFLESRGTWLAMIAAPNGRNYTLRAGDRLMDGVVRAITPDTVVIRQDVSDPMSSVKQREVRKMLRGGEPIP